MAADFGCFTCSRTSLSSMYISTYNLFSFKFNPSSSCSFRRQTHPVGPNFSKPLSLRPMSPHIALTSTNVKQGVDDDSSSIVPSLIFDYHRIDQQLLHVIAYDALVWASLHGLLMGDKSVPVGHSHSLNHHHHHLL